jgi:hypothetical protein
MAEVHEKSLGKGIDARNAENQIAPGYWESLVNAETDGDIVRKRRGYQQLGGYLPFRVQSIQYEKNDLCFNLDNYVDLSRLRSSPIMVRGTVRYDDLLNPHASWAPGVFTQKYYNEFNIAIRRSGIETPPASGKYIFTVPQAAHGHTSWIQHADVYLSTSESNLSNEFIYPDTLDINFTFAGLPQTLIDTDVQVNNTSSFIHASLDASTLGTEHYYPNTLGVPTFEPETVGTTSFGFDAAAEGLQSSNLIITVYEKNGTSLQKIIPDDITITGTSVLITLNTPVATGAEYFYVATAVPDTQVVAGQVTAVAQTVEIPGVTPFTGFAVYTLDGSVRELVIPDTADYDDATETLTITFDTNDSISYQIYYIEQTLQVNQLCVTDTNATTRDTDLVELDLYGIDPLSVMSIEDRNHWVSHLDTYRSSNLNQLIAGVAGVEYKLDTPSLDTLYPKYELILDEPQYLAPYFLSTGQTFNVPGRGFITSTEGFAGPEITDITYQPGTGYVRFTLSTPDLGVDDITDYTDIGGGFFTTTLENDLLTVENAGYAIMNGSHSIKLMTLDFNTDTVLIDCDVTGVTGVLSDEVPIGPDFDETDVGGYAQIYTTPITIKEGSNIPGNTILPGASIEIAGDSYEVRGNSFSSSERLFLDEVTAPTELSTGLFILGTTTTDVIPVRDTLVASINEHVRGDMIKYTSFDRWIRIKDIVQLTSRVVILDGNKVVLGGSDALNFEAGQKIAIMTEGLEGGVVVVNSVLNPTTLEVNKTFVATSGRLIGQTFEIDEELTVTDTIDNSLSFIPTARWHAIQKVPVPTSFTSELQTVKYPFNVFSTTQQRIIKSAMASDNIYLPTKNH